MQKKKTMQRMAAFGIPDHYLNVRSAFAETLGRYAEGEYDGTSRMVLVMEGPRTAPISGPDGDVAVDEIIMTAYRNKKEPIRSDGEPEHDIAGQKNEREYLGTVMEFRFRPIRRSETLVWASYREDLATVRALFERFVTEKIEKWYPEVGSLWGKHEAELERQDLEIIERYRQTESSATGATTEGGAETKQAQEMPAHTEQDDGEVGTTAKATKGVKGPQRTQRKEMRKLWQDREADIRERGWTQLFSGASSARGLSFETVQRWIPERIRKNWQTRELFTWEEFTELWPAHLRNDYAD